MVKNILLLILGIAVIIEGWLLFKRSEKVLSLSPSQDAQTMQLAPTIMSPYSLNRGMKLGDSPLSAKAFKIVPGNGNDDAKKAMDGWNLKTENLSDGSVKATLIPQGSEDINMVYLVKPGNTLYFVELNKGDDKDQQDMNLHDDYGVIVDSNGIVL